jgi:hypothetical protein
VNATRGEDVVTVSHDHFALGRGMWAMTAVIYGFFMLGVVAVVTDLVTSSDRDGLVFGALWAGGVLVSGWWLLRRMPRRVEVLDDGLRFVAPSRTVLVPWGSLRSVASPRFDINRQSLRWTWSGRTFRTWGPYDGELQRLLHIIRKRAPEAQLRRAVTRHPTWGLPSGPRR